jgi:hypothetical protein
VDKLEQMDLAGIVVTDWSGRDSYPVEFEEWLKNRPKELSSEFIPDGMSDRTWFYFQDWYGKFDTWDKEYRFNFYNKYMMKSPEWKRRCVSGEPLWRCSVWNNF